MARAPYCVIPRECPPPPPSTTSEVLGAAADTSDSTHGRRPAMSVSPITAARAALIFRRMVSTRAGYDRSAVMPQLLRAGSVPVVLGPRHGSARDHRILLGE